MSRATSRRRRVGGARFNLYFTTGSVVWWLRPVPFRNAHRKGSELSCKIFLCAAGRPGEGSRGRAQLWLLTNLEIGLSSVAAAASRGWPRRQPICFVSRGVWGGGLWAPRVPSAGLRPGPCAQCSGCSIGAPQASHSAFHFCLLALRRTPLSESPCHLHVTPFLLFGTKRPLWHLAGSQAGALVPSDL